MKDLELYKAQYEIEQELTNLNENNETSAFVDHTVVSGLDQGVFGRACAHNDSPGSGSGTYLC